MWPPPDRIWLGAGAPRTDPVGALPLVAAGAVAFGGVAGAVLVPGAALVFVPAAGSLALALATYWMLPAFREAWALTPSTLVHRPAVGATRAYPVARFVSASRAPARSSRATLGLGRARPGQPRDALELVATETDYTVTLGLDDGSALTTCPLADGETLVGLVEACVAGKIDLRLVARADRDEVPAEGRQDCFVALKTRWDHDEYGPCFVGPRLVARWSAPLSLVQEAMFASIAGRDVPAEELEPEIEALARAKDSGRVTVLERADCTFSLAAEALVVKAHGREVVVGLAPRRLAHARRWLALDAPYRR